MAQGLKLVNMLSETVQRRLSIHTNFADTYVVLAMAVLVLDESDVIRKMMMDYLEDSKVKQHG